MPAELRISIFTEISIFFPLLSSNVNFLNRKQFNSLCFLGLPRNFYKPGFYVFLSIKFPGGGILSSICGFVVFTALAIFVVFADFAIFEAFVIFVVFAVFAIFVFFAIFAIFVIFALFAIFLRFF